MKKIIITAALLMPMLFAASCSMFELDNYDGPNAEVTGKFYDMVTGEKQGIEAATYIMEHGICYEEFYKHYMPDFKY